MSLPRVFHGQETLDKVQGYIEGWEAAGDAMPSIAGLSIVLGTTRKTIHEWCRKWRDEPERYPEYEEFTWLIDTLGAHQERTLFNNGLTNKYNANICKLALAKHGYHDKQDTTIGSPGGGPLEIAHKEWKIIVCEGTAQADDDKEEYEEEDDD